MITFISRRRNALTNQLLNEFADVDYNFDYRGNSKALLLLKAWITASEVKSGDTMVYEGLACAFVSSFMKRKRKNIWYCNGPDMYSLKNAGKIKFSVFAYLLRKIDTICVISSMVEGEAKELFPRKKIVNVGIYPDKLIKCNKLNRPLNNKKIIMAVDRPTETGFIKGLDRALIQFQYLQTKDKEYTLTLIGKGTDTISLPDGVNGLGYVDTNFILDDFSYVLVPSRYDAFNLFAYEAISKGLYPLISNTCGIYHDLNLPDNFCLGVHETSLSDLLSKVDTDSYSIIRSRFEQLKDRCKKEKMFENLASVIYDK